MRVRWASSAEQDRADIFDHIAQDSPLAAVRMDELFVAAAQRLGRHPMPGRSGRIPGTRELIPHANDRPIYEMHGDTVWILALVHTARMWP
ncbi:MAG: hypothetical protein RIS35_2529 [Pseudomonadota bacterium]|jgi:plasmid stabilization system protein ParE